MTIVSQRRIACYASLFTLVFALVLASPVRAQNANADAVPQKEVAAKLAYCEVCHGVSAQGFNGYYPIPRLAGQQITYTENQLQAFAERKRTLIDHLTHDLRQPVQRVSAVQRNRVRLRLQKIAAFAH